MGAGLPPEGEEEVPRGTEAEEHQHISADVCLFRPHQMVNGVSQPGHRACAAHADAARDAAKSRSSGHHLPGNTLQLLIEIRV